MENTIKLTKHGYSDYIVKGHENIKIIKNHVTKDYRVTVDGKNIFFKNDGCLVSGSKLYDSKELIERYLNDKAWFDARYTIGL